MRMSRSRRAAQPPKTTAKKHRQVLPQGLWHMVKGWICSLGERRMANTTVLEIVAAPFPFFYQVRTVEYYSCDCTLVWISATFPSLIALIASICKGIFCDEFHIAKACGRGYHWRTF